MPNTRRTQRKIELREDNALRREKMWYYERERVVAHPGALPDFPRKEARMKNRNIKKECPKCSKVMRSDNLKKHLLKCGLEKGYTNKRAN